MIRTLNDIGNIKSKRVIVRVDWNVPVNGDGVITDGEIWRVHQSMKTIHFLMNAGAKVIIISHIGRDPKATLRPVYDYVVSHGERDMGFLPVFDAQATPLVVQNLADGHAVVLENLRSNAGEESNDPDFAQALAACGDIFVNDAFSVSHRAHASVVGISQLLPSFAGFQFIDELQNLEKIRDPLHPSVVIIGGVKFETKLPVIKHFLEVADTVVLGGALANTLLQARGYSIGASIIDGVELVQDFKDNEKLMIPVDVVVVDKNGESKTIPVTDVGATDVIVDIGPQTTNMIKEKISIAQSVLWNGPLGWYEKGYTASSFAIADALAQSRGATVVGGGDTVAALHERDALKQVSFVSTAGGAMLEYLAQGTLPGIEALDHSISQHTKILS